VNLVRTHVLGPAIVVVRSRMNTSRNVIFLHPRRPSLGGRRGTPMEAKKYRRCCGIDVHKKSVTVCILAPAGKPEWRYVRGTFGPLPGI
jgi:hypothetical protein